MQRLSLTDVPQDAALDADICIVGSGPAGATLLRELAGSGLRVVLAESGGLVTHPFADALNEIENVGVARTLDQTIVRNRILGGTSHCWAGRCIGLDDIDYGARPWVEHSGWPLDARTMHPYLVRSAAHLGLGLGAGFSGEDFWVSTGRRRPRPAIDERLLRPLFWQFSRSRSLLEPMRFGPRLLSERADGVRVLTHATLVHIDTDEAGGQVRSVELAAPDDRRWTLRTPVVVLAAGGIENPRLLLASNRTVREGLGNGRGLVGRFLMDHPRGGVGRFAPDAAEALAPHFGLHGVRTAGGMHLFCQGLRLSPEIQEREGLLNCAVWLSELVSPDDPWTAVKRIARRQAGWRRDAWSVAQNPAMVARGLYRTLTTGRGVPRKLDGLELNCTVEQQPDPHSRITLSDRVDSHGVPLSRLHWCVNEQERRTVWRATSLVIEALGKLGLPAPQPEDWVRDHAEFPSSFSDVAHHIGTTRMSAGPGTGVVNADCRVHGVQGLFVAGSSVFPTGGHANPTQMIVALAIRLADHLRGIGSAGPLSSGTQRQEAPATGPRELSPVPD